MKKKKPSKNRTLSPILKKKMSYQPALPNFVQAVTRNKHNNIIFSLSVSKCVAIS